MYNETFQQEQDRMMRRKVENNTKKCDICSHIQTPKGKQCYTLGRILKEEIDNKGLPFYPEFVIPILENFAVKCKRYKTK